MDELYAEMKKKLHEMYVNRAGSVTIDIRTFFMLYKAVCDLMHIEKIVKNL